MIVDAGQNTRIVLLRGLCWGLTLVILVLWGLAVLYVFPTTLVSQFYNVMMPLVFFALAGVLYLRRSSDPQALTSGLMLVFLGPYLIAGVGSAFEAIPGWGLLILILEWIGLGLVTYFLLTFPGGAAVPYFARWLPFLLPLLAAAFYIVLGQEQFLESGVMIYCFLAGMAFGLVAQIYRYWRVSDRVARQQTKWVTLGFVGPILTTGIWFFFFLPMEASGEPVSQVGALVEAGVAALLPLTLPLGITISILRYRLWDIDVIIRRTVAYGLVTGTLILIYFFTIIALQQIFSTLTGSAQNEIVTVLSTLVIAVLFVPLRRRFQAIIDRRFNRNKYDAGQIMQDFANTVRDETDLEQLTARLVQVVDETMQPKSISVWLKKETQGEIAK